MGNNWSATGKDAHLVEQQSALREDAGSNPIGDTFQDCGGENKCKVNHETATGKQKNVGQGDGTYDLNVLGNWDE